MIRLATPADAPDVARVHVATWRVAYAGLVPAPALDARSVPAAASRWEGHLGDPGVRAWVALAGGAVAGFVSAGPPRDADLSAAWGEVYAAYVLPAAQRAGLGRACWTLPAGGSAAPDGLGWRCGYCPKTCTEGRSTPLVALHRTARTAPSTSGGRSCRRSGTPATSRQFAR